TRLTIFPYTPLFRSKAWLCSNSSAKLSDIKIPVDPRARRTDPPVDGAHAPLMTPRPSATEDRDRCGCQSRHTRETLVTAIPAERDRKSTRLNSSHVK